MTDDALMRARQERVLPHNFEAEMAVLGAILTSNAAYDRVASFLRASDFADQRHGLIFEAISVLRARGLVADPITLRDHMAAAGRLEGIGGPEYLVRLAQSIVSVVNAEDYARIVWDRRMRRELMLAADDIADQARAITLEETADQIAGRFVNRLSEIMASSNSGRLVSIFDCATEALDSAERGMKAERGVIGIPTGLRDIDNLLGGLKRGRLVVLAGRPGMGKSTVAANMAAVAASRGHSVCFFQLEMMPDEMGAMMISTMTALPMDRILRGRVSVKEFSTAFDAAAAMREWRLYVDKTPKITVAEMRARARPLKPDLIFVDHLTLVGGSAPGQHNVRKVELTGLVSGALKEMAKEMHCPVVALCQLRRPAEGREDERPHLESLRWAGEIEQDADDVLLLYRARYYLERIPEDRRDTKWFQAWEATENVLEIIIGKNRGGAGANRIVKVQYNPATGIVGDLDMTPRNSSEQPLLPQIA